MSEVFKFKNETEILIHQELGRRSVNAVTLFNSLLKKPTISIEQVMTFCSISYKAANDLVKEFVRLNILTETTGQSRNRFFKMKKYLDIFS
ncbi:MAG: hypothetical protein II956_10505 [Bacteroidales bacterium]|nr:hypothetical protein [Bacteroidales bacterium]